MTEDFIKMISEIHSQRYLLQMQNLVNNKIPCGFFCCFSVNESLPAIVQNIKNIGINLTCICIVDRSQATTNLNLPYVLIEALPNSQFKPQFMFHLEPTNGQAFYDYFKRYGIELMLFADFNFMETMYHFHMQNLSRLYKVYEMLSDEESKKVFAAFIKGKITQNTGDFIFAPEPQYFLKDFLPVENDIAIDGGSFDGGTSRDFAMQGAKVYAFEMDSVNYQNCLPRAQKYNFTIENMGLSSQEGEEIYSGNGAASAKGYGNLIARFTDLDTYVIKKNLPRVNYIKLDIEGAELDMLHGAAKTIARWKPKMAVSAYHKWEDLFTLAEYIKSIRPDYEFKFRHYKMDCTDYVLTDEQRAILRRLQLGYLVPTVAESVLYCH